MNSNYIKELSDWNKIFKDIKYLESFKLKVEKELSQDEYNLYGLMKISKLKKKENSLDVDILVKIMQKLDSNTLELFLERDILNYSYDIRELLKNLLIIHFVNRTTLSRDDERNLKEDLNILAEVCSKDFKLTYKKIYFILTNLKISFENLVELYGKEIPLKLIEDISCRFFNNNDTSEINNPEYAFKKEEKHLFCNKILKTLTPREEKVIRMLYGIGENYQYSSKEIAKEFFVTEERISQIINKSLRKLRNPSRSYILKDL